MRPMTREWLGFAGVAVDVMMTRSFPDLVLGEVFIDRKTPCSVSSFLPCCSGQARTIADTCIGKADPLIVDHNAISLLFSSSPPHAHIRREARYIYVATFLDIRYVRESDARKPESSANTR